MRPGGTQSDRARSGDSEPEEDDWQETKDRGRVTLCEFRGPERQKCQRFSLLSQAAGPSAAAPPPPTAACDDSARRRGRQRACRLCEEFLYPTEAAVNTDRCWPRVSLPLGSNPDRSPNNGRRRDPPWQKSRSFTAGHSFRAPHLKGSVGARVPVPPVTVVLAARQQHRRREGAHVVETNGTCYSRSYDFGHR
jgi:hypothetical protein